jgi:hypothetical protein
MADYLPVANFRQSWIKETMGPIDVMLVKTSPPDENGFMSFGHHVWLSRTVAELSKHIICEIDESLIRTYGENFLHVSARTTCASTSPPMTPTAPSRSRPAAARPSRRRRLSARSSRRSWCATATPCRWAWAT